MLAQVDDTDTTLGTLSTVMGTTFGIKTSFHGLLHNTLAQVGRDVVLFESPPLMDFCR